MADCEIDWTPISLQDWEERFKSVKRSTLLQHFPYAQANRLIHQAGARHGVIKINGTAAGMLQLGETGLFNKLIHTVSLDRGPLWFEGYGAVEHIDAFFSCLWGELPRRMGRKIRLLPELADNTRNRNAVSRAGFLRRESFPGYETIWLDLRKSENELRTDMRPNWRSTLSKAQRGSLSIHEDWSGENAHAFIEAYHNDRLAKRYSGPSNKLLAALIAFMAPRREALILTATEKGQPIAAILVLLHGTSATYQTGWTSERGRKTGAHHLLLWSAIGRLKKTGIKDFDLGGINGQNAPGVTKFKQGLGGQPIGLAGFFH